MADSSSGRPIQSSPPVGEESTPSSLDDRIDALADERRRKALECLARADGSLPLADLVEFLATSDAGETPLANDPDHVAIRLHHVHLPKLADAGLVEYDERRQEVAPTEAGARLHPLLEEL